MTQLEIRNIATQMRDILWTQGYEGRSLVIAMFKRMVCVKCGSEKHVSCINCGHMDEESPDATNPDDDDPKYEETIPVFDDEDD
jgi:hypothetical protein